MHCTPKLPFLIKKYHPKLPNLLYILICIGILYVLVLEFCKKGRRGGCLNSNG